VSACDGDIISIRALRHGWVYSDIIAGQGSDRKQRPSDDPPWKNKCGGGEGGEALLIVLGSGWIVGKERDEVIQ
jgi:hypothetical protein